MCIFEMIKKALNRIRPIHVLALGLVIALGLLISTPENAHAGVVASGSCGSSVTWSLDDAGVMTISGSGEMESYDGYDKSPWYDFREKIKTLVIADGVTAVGQYAFCSCSSIECITMPVNAKIARNAFGYISWTNFKMNSLMKVTLTGKGDMFNYTPLTVNNATVKWNSYEDTPWYLSNAAGNNVEVIIGEDITSIGEYAFYGCSRITRIVIPKAIKSIGKYAFYNCQCAVLDGLFIPDEMTSIGEYTFCYCYKITGDIIIPEKVTTIEQYAFCGCSGIESLTMPVNAKIARYAFGSSSWSNCRMDSLVKVTLTGKGDMINYTANTVNNATVKWNSYEDTPWYLAHCAGNSVEIIICSGVTSIGKKAFYNCYRISEVSISKTVTEIGDDAFYNCTGLATVLYGGNEAAWDKVSKGGNNTALDTVDITFGKEKAGNTGNTGNTGSSTNESGEAALSETKKSLSAGNKFTLTLENATGKITWKSSNSAVAKVKNGVVTAVGAGTATITATNNGVKYKCKVTVTGDAGLNKTSATIKVGESFKLKVTGTTAVSFKSSKKSVAKVTSSGKVVGKKAGTATIKVKCENGETYTCKVTVKK